MRNNRAKTLILNVSEDEVISFLLALSSPYAMIATNQLTLNYPKDVRQHAHLIKCEDYLMKELKINNFSKIDWSLIAFIIASIPKHLHVWLSKRLLTFAGTAHQLHRQKVCSSPICRCFLIEPELDTLHVIECNHHFS